EKRQIYLAQSHIAEPTGERTLFSTDISWDEASSQTELDKVKSTVLGVQVATILGWALAIVGAVLLLICAWRFSRQRAQ
ncbi:MAG: porin PorA family protein, partial [Corynebacterium casei]|nr:porin PorA family protein [Corynebacterium casei]